MKGKKQMDDFCKILSQLETQSGLTEAEYCKKLGIPRSTYRDWKYGQVPKSIQYLFQIIQFHSLPILYLNQINQKGGHHAA